MLEAIGVAERLEGQGCPIDRSGSATVWTRRRPLRCRTRRGSVEDPLGIMFETGGCARPCVKRRRLRRM
jgi:hypothetical protein